MARACQVTFQLLHETKFATVICGYHVYKTISSSVIGEVLHPKPDTSTEALEHDRFAIAVVKVEDNGTELLVCQSKFRAFYITF